MKNNLLISAAALLMMAAAITPVANGQTPNPHAVPYNPGQGSGYDSKGYGGGDYYLKGYSGYGGAQPKDVQPGFLQQPPTQGMPGAPHPAAPSPLVPNYPY